MHTAQMDPEQMNGTAPPHDTRCFVTEERLVHLLDAWHPSSPAEVQALTNELLRHAGALANLLYGLAEERAVSLDVGQHIEPVDPWDMVSVHELLASLIEMSAAVLSRQPSTVVEPN